MTDTKQKRLIIDLEKCDQCESCNVTCGYHDRAHDCENGLATMRLRAAFAVICRRCASASCVDACVFDALERRSDGILQHHNLRCVSCKMCAHACPFGTIYTDMLPFYEVSCESCLGRNDTEPPCVTSCPQGALEYRQVGSSEADVHIVDQYLATRAERWLKQELRS